MRQIAYHVCCDLAKQLRADRMRHGGSIEDQSLGRHAALSEEDGLRRAYDREAQERMHKALAACSSKERQAFLLRYENGLKLEEIADFMDVSLASVKRYIQAARETLQEKFSA